MGSKKRDELAANKKLIGKLLPAALAASTMVVPATGAAGSIQQLVDQVQAAPSLETRVLDSQTAWQHAAGPEVVTQATWAEVSWGKIAWARGPFDQT